MVRYDAVYCPRIGLILWHQIYDEDDGLANANPCQLTPTFAATDSWLSSPAAPCSVVHWCHPRSFGIDGNADASRHPQKRHFCSTILNLLCVCVFFGGTVFFLWLFLIVNLKLVSHWLCLRVVWHFIIMCDQYVSQIFFAMLLPVPFKKKTILSYYKLH